MMAGCRKRQVNVGHHPVMEEGIFISHDLLVGFFVGFIVGPVVIGLVAHFFRDQEP